MNKNSTTGDVAQRGALRRCNDGTIYVTLNDVQTKGVNTMLAEGLYGDTPAECLRRILDNELIRRCQNLPTQG